MRSLPVVSGVRRSPDLDLATRRFQALSDETRLQIVDLLAGGERCVCVLTDALEVSQPLLSHHLKNLKGAGLVTDRRDGRWVYYSLNHDALEAVKAFLDRLGSRRELACVC